PLLLCVKQRAFLFPRKYSRREYISRKSVRRKRGATRTLFFPHWYGILKHKPNLHIPRGQRSPSKERTDGTEGASQRETRTEIRGRPLDLRSWFSLWRRSI